MTEITPPMPANKIAFVIDGKVVDIIYAHDRLAAVLLIDPLILDITDVKSESNTDIHMDYTYNETTKTFSPPVVGA